MQRRSGMRRCWPVVLALLLVLSGLMLSGCSIVDPNASVPRIKPQDLRSRLSKGEEIIVVDARVASAYALSHIEGAISMPLPEVSQRMSELPEDATIVFYCT